MASNFNCWAGPNNHLLDLCNYLYNDLHVNLRLISHNSACQDDFKRWIHFPFLPVLNGASATPQTRLKYSLPNANQIDKLIKFSKISKENIFVNSNVDTLASTSYAVKAKVKTGYNVLSNNPTSPLFNTIDKLAAKTLISKILAHSEFHGRIYTKIGIDQKKIQIIPHCISVKRVEEMSRGYAVRSKTGPIIFYCGRLTIEKGVEALINAFEKFSKRNESTLIILGKGPLDEYVVRKKKIIERTTKGKVDFIGWQPPSLLLRYMRQADMVIVPSFSEAFGLVILEAMCLRKPVIASSVGGIPEILTHNLNGLLVKPGNVNGIVAAMTELVTDKRKSESIAMNAYKTVQEKFSVEQIAPKFLDFMKL